jgi:hypothetical protein
MRDENKVMNIIMIVLFFVFLGMIIWAQKTVSVRNLMIERLTNIIVSIQSKT